MPTCTRPLCESPDDVPSRTRPSRTPALCRAHAMEQEADQALSEGLLRTARLAYARAGALYLEAIQRST